MPNSSKNPSITTVTQLLRYVRKNCDDGFYLFRGQPLGQPLLPRIARPRDESQKGPEDLLRAERQLVEQFKRRCTPHLEIQPRDQWDLLAIAQHHGMATRLLDWTENPLAALWFGIQNSRFRDDKVDGTVWTFRVEDEDQVTTVDDHAGPLNCARTKVFQPSHITKRIAAQSAWFTLHRYLDEKKKFIALERNSIYKHRLAQVTVPRRTFGPLAIQLNSCGINAASLFPDIGGLCAYLDWWHLYR